MKRKLFSSLFALSLSALFCIATITPTHCSAIQNDGLAILRETSKAFGTLAKKTTPAVVFIESTLSAKEAFKKRRGASESPFEFFNEDFLNRFFGIPEGKLNAKKEQAFGSGFIVSPDGYIMTNNHVVQDAENVKVTLGERHFTAKVVGTDPKTDVAIIKIDAKDLPYLELGDSTSLEVGELVMAIGNPFELVETVTVGVVSAKGRNQLHINDFEDFIQTDAAINPGNSGGPLINMDGKVVGMNTAIVSPGRTGYIGIGFAVPAHLMKPVMDQLIKNGKVVRGFLGIVLQPVDADLASSFGLDKPQGALIAEVASDSPAAASDLKSGDIILKYNNKPVVNISDFRTNISMLNPGTQLNLTVYREGKTLNIPVQVGSQSEKSEDETVEAPPVLNQLGLSVEELTPELAARFGFSKDSGVIVSKVSPGSLGEKAGIKVGTLIMAIDRKKITSVGEFNKAVSDALNAKHILLLVKQGAATRYIALKF